MAEDKRKEKDTLGEMEIPQDAYYGIQTLRAVSNFPVSGLTNHPYLIDAYASIKEAAALANMEVGWLPREIGTAIVQAAREVRTGNLRDQFLVDRFQAGAGTSTNMNTNEVIANRALEILGYAKGRYDLISPNDHVNMAQSTNDTFPTAMQISVFRMTRRLIEVVRSLISTLYRKGEEFRDVLKTGRTHLQDAMPVSLGGEFIAYGTALERVTLSLEKRSQRLLEMPLGGTATGTGINTHPEYRERAVSHLARITGLELIPNPRSYESMQSTTRIVSVSSSYKELAIELGRIANDLRLMSSGPTSGFSEIQLPAVQPGSSIMPGKVNPVLPECLNQICFVVIGNDVAITQAAGAGQLELNVMMPIMGNLILRSAEYLVNFLPVFDSKCVSGIGVNAEELNRRALNNPALATLLNRKIGYLKAAEVAKESASTGKPVREIVVKKGLLTEEEAAAIFDRSSLLGRMH
ncbi:MAG: aspartate ammonia-lyase [Thermoplasmatota archaeon]